MSPRPDRKYSRQLYERTLHERTPAVLKASRALQDVLGISKETCMRATRPVKAWELPVPPLELAQQVPSEYVSAGEDDRDRLESELFSDDVLHGANKSSCDQPSEAMSRQQLHQQAQDAVGLNIDLSPASALFPDLRPDHNISGLVVRKRTESNSSDISTISNLRQHADRKKPRILIDLIESAAERTACQAEEKCPIPSNISSLLFSDTTTHLNTNTDTQPRRSNNLRYDPPLLQAPSEIASKSESASHHDTRQHHGATADLAHWSYSLPSHIQAWLRHPQVKWRAYNLLSLKLADTVHSTGFAHLQLQSKGCAKLSLMHMRLPDAAQDPLAAPRQLNWCVLEVQRFSVEVVRDKTRGTDEAQGSESMTRSNRYRSESLSTQSDGDESFEEDDDSSDEDDDSDDQDVLLCDPDAEAARRAREAERRRERIEHSSATVKRDFILAFPSSAITAETSTSFNDNGTVRFTTRMALGKEGRVPLLYSTSTRERKDSVTVDSCTAQLKGEDTAFLSGFVRACGGGKAVLEITCADEIVNVSGRG